MKKFGKGGKLSPEMEKKMEKMINDPIPMMPFVLYPVYDISEVANDKGEGASSVEKASVKSDQVLSSIGDDKLGKACLITDPTCQSCQ